MKTRRKLEVWMIILQHKLVLLQSDQKWGQKKVPKHEAGFKNI